VVARSHRRGAAAGRNQENGVGWPIADPAPAEPARAREELTVSSDNTAATAISATVKAPIAHNRLDDLDVAIAVARSAVVVGVVVAAIVLRDPTVVMVVVGACMRERRLWRDCGNAERKQQESSAQQTTYPIDEHGWFPFLTV
jgi:hypothetical protein